MATSTGATDWQVGKSVVQSLSYILESQIHCDVFFALPSVDGDRRQIGAHTLIMTTRSPVFEAMFSDRWNRESNVIEIEDIDSEIFREFLKFLYTDHCSITASTALGLLYASRKYMLPTLIDKCLAVINGNIDKDIVCTLYQKSKEFGENELKEKCRKFINRYADDSLLSADFLNLGYDALHELVSSDELLAENEAVVYSACLRWAKAQCTKTGVNEADGRQCREALGDVLYQIRLTSMKPDTFCALMGDSNILTDAEMGVIYHSLHRGQTNVDIGFNCSPRQQRPVLTVNRFSALEGDYTTSDQQPTTDAILLTTDKDIILRGVKLMADISKDLPAGTLTIKCLNIQELSVKFQPKSDGLVQYKIKIDPIPLMAGKQYELGVEWKNKDNKFSYNWRRSSEQKPYGYSFERIYKKVASTTVNVDGVQLTFAKKDGMSSTTAEFGQFPEFTFSVL